MEGFVIMVFVIGVFIALAVKASAARTAKANAAWAGAARALGLRYQDPPFGGARRMEGSLPSGPVVVETFTRSSGKSSTTYTRYRARFVEPLGLGIRLSREGFFTGIGKLLGAEDIEVGDTAFDSQVVVKGDDARRVVEFLRPNRRSRILRAMSTYPGLVVADAEVLWESVGLHTDSARIAGTIRQLSQLAWALSSDEERVPPEPASAPAAVRDQPASPTSQRTAARGPQPVVRPPPAPTPPADDSPEASVVAAAAAALASARVLPSGRPSPVEGSRARAETTAPGTRPPGPAVSKTPLADARRSAASFLSGQASGAASRLVDTAPLSAPPPVSSPPSPPFPARQEPVPSEASSPPIALDAVAVCEDLFRPEHTGLEVEKLFEERYAGRAVDWRGTLEGADEFSYDFVFGNEPGTKAVVLVHETRSGLYGAQPVRATVRLPAGQTAVRSLAGKPVRLQGRLVRVDSFLRHIFVASGSIHADTA